MQSAIITALKYHANQTRKGNPSIPAIAHPFLVAILLSNCCSDEKMIASAILHDILEDTSYSLKMLRADFGPEVSDIVEALSEDKGIKDWLERKNENLIRLKKNETAYSIKIFDCIANMSELLHELTAQGSRMWNVFNAPKNLKLDYFHRIFLDNIESMPKTIIIWYMDLLKNLEYFSDSKKASAIGFKS